MSKRKSTMKKFIDLLKHRRSCRQFSEEIIDNESIDYILKSALMSPSGHRRTPWEFIVVEDKRTLKALSVSKASGATLIEKAAAAIVITADTTKTDVWIEDCSIASINMQLAAEELGLGSCWVQIRLREDSEGNSANDNVKLLLGIPEQFSVLSIIALGHKEQESQPFDENDLKWNKVHRGKFENNNYK